MCGRSVVPKSRTYHELAAKYGIDKTILRDDAPLEIRPGSTVHAFLNWRGTPVLLPVHWGFSYGDGGLYNARSESVAQTPMWKGPFETQRCAIPLQGFYENGKFFARKDGEEMMVLGLYGVTPETKKLTMTMLTCEANAVVAVHHHRMPLLMPNNPVSLAKWLTDDSTRNAVVEAATDWTINCVELQAA